MKVQLPAKYAEAAEPVAVEYARAEISWFRTNKFQLFGIDVDCFDEASNQHFARQVVKHYALSHPTRMMVIVDDARAGWDLADEALRELILEFLDRGEQLPTYLAAYNMDIVARGLVPRRIPGPKRSDHFFRDLAITVIVDKVCTEFGFKPTRTRYATRPSGCSVVAAALAASEHTIVTIWRHYGVPNLIP